MKGTRILGSAPRSALFVLLGLGLALINLSDLRAQELHQPAAAAPPAEAPASGAAAAAAPEAEVVQRRITRARSLAAVGKLAAAASELESLRSSTADASVQDAARILLMAIYVEMPDYGRATTLLEESYKARGGQPEAARSYYALAGQTVGSVRTHVERYRSFGLNVADDDLPAEAKGDLEQMRGLLEKVFEQARGIREEEVAKSGGAGQGVAATALIEDAANVRLRLARGEQERAKWRQEVSEARQRLVAGETRIARVSDIRGADAPTAASAAPFATAYVAPSPSAGAPAASKERAVVPPAPKAAAPAPKAEAARPEANAGAAAAGVKGAAGLVAVGSLHDYVAKRVDPTYPSIAKTARVSGVVTVFVVVDERGAVESVQRADGPIQLQAAATDAVRRWKFRPTLVNGQPARVSGFINFNFSLKNGS